jgi:hypothetical protein
MVFVCYAAAGVGWLLVSSFTQPTVITNALHLSFVGLWAVRLAGMIFMIRVSLLLIEYVRDGSSEGRSI